MVVGAMTVVVVMMVEARRDDGPQPPPRWAEAEAEAGACQGLVTGGASLLKTSIPGTADKGS